MPIKIPDSLPARATLESENIFVMTEYRAIHQDMRPLNLLILNLMPTKIVTETQLLRKLSNTPLQIQVELLQMSSHTSHNTDADHLSSFYTTFDQIRDRRYDGMIITGAPVENLDFTQVDYWDELCEIMEWSKTHVHSTLHICWGAQAGLYYHYGIEKRSLPEKLFGVFDHRVLKPSSPLFRGFDDVFQAPHSRYTEVYESDIRATPGLELLSISGDAGVFGPSHPRPLPLFPQQRPFPSAHRPLAERRPAALYQLAQLLRLPDHPLRHFRSPLIYAPSTASAPPVSRRRFFACKPPMNILYLLLYLQYVMPTHCLWEREAQVRAVALGKPGKP